MTDPKTNDGSQNERLAEILAAYLESERSGLTLDRDRLLAEHSELADELRAFFADHDRMKAVAEPRRVAEPSAQKPGILKMPGFLPAEDATLMPQRPSDVREPQTTWEGEAPAELCPAEPYLSVVRGSAGALPSRASEGP